MKDGSKSERSCAVCRSVHCKSELIRFVADPAGYLQVDYQSRLPGRGVYTCIDRRCIFAAVKKNSFTRALKQPVTVPDFDDLLQTVASCLNRRILNLIGMARKSGSIVSGSTSVLQELSKPSASLLIVATDAAEGTAEKIVNRAKGSEVPFVKIFNKQTLGNAVGRDERSHLVLTDKQFAKNLILEIDRLKNLAGEN